MKAGLFAALLAAADGAGALAYTGSAGGGKSTLALGARRLLPFYKWSPPPPRGKGTARAKRASLKRRNVLTNRRHHRG